MQRYDLLVSGAGPAGAMSAYWAAKAGLSTLLVERHEIPRQKCCAGGLLGRAEAMLDFPLPDHLVKRRIDSVGVIIEGNRERFSAGKGIAATVDRGEFDAYLAGRAEDAGAELATGESVATITESGDFIEATIGGVSIIAKAAIIAEGAASANANKLFGPRAEGYTAMGAMAPFSTDDGLDSSLDFYLFDTPTSGMRFGRYFPVNGWMFPHVNGGNIGVAGTGLRNDTIERHLSDIRNEMAQHGVKMKQGQVSSRPIPFRPRPRLYSRRCVAVGDSAGFANPISGEGMTYAFLSAKHASSSIVEFLQEDASALSRYQRRCGDKIARDLTAASLIGPVAHWLVGVVDTKRFLKVLHEHDKVVETAVSIADGDNDWRALFMRMIPEFFPLFFSSLPGSQDSEKPGSGIDQT